MITRYPVTVVFLLAATIINGIEINEPGDRYIKYLITFVVGAFLSAVLQAVFERFYHKATARMSLMSLAALLTIGYYLIILPLPRLSIEIGIRTLVATFALYISFLWVPGIKSRISFNESFMAAFKALFITAFFSGIIFAGISIIFGTIDLLITNVNYRTYLHTANIVFVLFAPMYFLSFTPNYPGERNKDNEEERIKLQEETIQKTTNCPKYLEILISYIIIPLTAVFTIILLIYIVQNIAGKFWTNNLLEPMLVAYSITVIIVYILASRLSNKFAELFRMIFPKVLVLIVIFQVISSFLKIGEEGITFGRYYVILFGIFAAIAGVVFSTLPVRKNGIVAAILIILSIISIVPPVDAFTVSKASQVSMLKRVLVNNNMLDDNVITPNASISEHDKQLIVKSVNYLRMMEYIDQITWLEDFNRENNFNVTFGFAEYEQFDKENQYINVNLKQNMPIEIAGYDTFIYSNITINDNSEGETKISDFAISSKNYSLTKSMTGDNCIIKLQDNNKQDIISFETKEIFDSLANYSNEKELLTAEKATFSKENEQSKMTLVIQNINIDRNSNRSNYYADLYILVDIK